MGSKDDFAILVHLSHQADSVIIWDYVKDNEFRNFDVPKDYEILWDSNGEAYILQQDKLTMTKLNCSLHCYDEIESVKQLLRRNFNFPLVNSSKGHCFDGLNHNWYVLQQYLSLSFSYMTFAIKERIELEEDESD